MAHVPEGVLRRLIDEPFMVADRHVRHVEGCARCARRAAKVAADAEGAASLLQVPPGLGDPERGWARRPPAPRTGAAPGHLGRHRRLAVARPSLGTGVLVGAAALVVAGAAAAATLTTVFAPSTVAPAPLGTSGLAPLAGLVGVTSPAALTGFSEPSGTKSLADGTLTWSSAGAPETFVSLSAAEAAAGVDLSLPGVLPNGVGAPSRYVALREVRASFTFNAHAGATLSGSTLAVTVGPGVGALYGAATGTSSTMAIAAITRPLVTSNGATTSELENFLLAQPGVPPALAEALRLVSNLQSTLPVPVPSGVQSSSVVIDTAPGILLTDGTGAASAAIWEDKTGQVHVVAGLLDSADLLNVARQVG